MKKIIKTMLILAISICMIFALTGCGKKEETQKVENTEEDVNEEVEEVEEVKQKEFSIGEWNGKVYTNDFLGLTFTEGEGWTHLNDEEIAEKMNIGKELLNDNQKAAFEISKLNSVYFMIANNTNTGDNINIIAEKNTLNISEDNYLNSVKNQLQVVDSIEYEIGDTSEEKIGNVDCKVLTTYGTYSGVKLVQKYYIYKVNDYIVSIIATTTSGESQITEIMSNFS